MAKSILWVFVIVGFMMAIGNYKNGTSMETYTKIITLASLAVLAICEAIEKSKKV